jgi:signal transduction histidine kinase
VIDSLYLISPLLLVAAAGVLIVLVGRGAGPSTSKWLFCGYLFTLGLWGLFLFGMRSSATIEQALPWERALPATSFATFALYYHFTITFTNRRLPWGVLFAIYTCLVVIGALSPTDLLIKQMRLEYYGYAPVVGPLTYFLSLGGLALLGGGVFNLISRYRSSPSYEERNRYIYFIIAVILPLAGALLDAFSNLPPTAVFCNLAFSILCSVAILKYHLLDVNVVLRRGLVYLLVSVMVAIPYVAAIYGMNYFLQRRIALWWLNAILIIVIAIFLRPLYDRVHKLVDRWFYREKYDYLKALETFIQEARGTNSLDSLSSTLLRLVSGALGTENICLLMPSEGKRGYSVFSAIGLSGIPAEPVIEEDSLLIRWFQRESRILILKEVGVFPELQSISQAERQTLQNLRGELLVPIIGEEHSLSGILVLGPKRSQQIYTSEDSRLLITLAGQMSITFERARAYNDNLQARKNLETWLHGMRDGVIIVDTNGTIRFANNAAIETLGMRVGEKCWTTLGKDEKCTSCPLTHLKDEQSSSHPDIGIRGREYEVVAAQLSNPDGSQSIIEVFRDTTERKIMIQELLNKTEELEAANKAKADFLATMSHELRTPLNAIIGFSELMLDGALGRINEEQKECINDIFTSGQHLLNLINAVLDLTKVEAKKLELGLERLDIAEIISNSVQIVTPLLNKYNHNLNIGIEKHFPEVLVDRQRVMQILLNLLGNAIKFTEPGGQLGIEVIRKDNFCQISVSDNGSGIKKEYQDRMFEVFFQGEPLQNRTREGTGLGLALTKKLVEVLGGKIWFESEYGKGSKFTFTVPFAS